MKTSEDWEANRAQFSVASKGEGVCPQSGRTWVCSAHWLSLVGPDPGGRCILPLGLGVLLVWSFLS